MTVKTARKGRVVVKKEMCKGCMLCVEYCKRNVLRVSECFNKMGYHPAEADENAECTACMVCTLVCPEVAIEVYDEEDRSE